MTENNPPIPLAPQYDAPEGYASHGPGGRVPGSEPPYGPPQPYNQAPPAPYGQQLYPQPQYAPYPQPQHAPYLPQQYAPYPQQPQHAPYLPQQYAPPAQWGPAGLRKPKSSGHRVSSGIVGILLGTWLFIPSIAGFEEGGAGFMSFLVLVAALGNVTAGIVLLANQRSRNQGPPITSLSLAGFAVLLGLIGLTVPYFGAALLVTSLLLAAPVLIVMGIGLSREKRGA